MSSYRLSKVAVAIGGFLMLMGITMIDVFALVFSGVIDISLLKKEFARVDITGKGMIIE